MINFLTRFFIILTVFCSGTLLAMIGHDDDDIRLSKKSFLVSSLPYNIGDMDKGVVTLCFKKPEKKGAFVYDHVSLVFEMFFPNKTSTDVSVHMIHYGGEEACCGGVNKKPIIESRESTIKKVYRATKVDVENSDKIIKYLPATYERYASWILPNSDLIKGFHTAKKDDEEHEKNKRLYDSYSCVGYVQKIMKTIGIKNVDIGFRFFGKTTPDDLKKLVKNCMDPKPSTATYEEITIPRCLPFSRNFSKFVMQKLETMEKTITFNLLSAQDNNSAYY